jgi:hypothetical protein
VSDQRPGAGTPIDEAVLRRALRLEAYERMPRLDVAALRASAEHGHLSPAVSLMGSLAFAVIGLAAVTTVLPVVLEGATLGSAIALIALVARPLEAVLVIATQPAVPIAIVTALVIAAFAERRLAMEEIDA